MRRIARRPSMFAALIASLAIASPHAALAAPGDRDTTFDDDGFASLDAGGSEDIYDVAVHEGMIVVAGSTTPTKGDTDFVVARFESDGDPDPGFGGGNGFVTTDFGGGQDVSSGVAVLPNGRILVAGWSTLDGNIYRVTIAKYRANGTLDPTFGGGDGKVVKSFGFEDGAVSYDLLLLPSGKFLVGGGAYRTVDGSDLAVWRFKANGTLDMAFGGGDGTARKAVAPGYDEAWRLLLMADGDIVAGGWSELDGDAGYDLLVVRFRADGRLRRSFGDNGAVVLDPTGANTDFAAGLARSGGKIVIVDPGEDGTGDGEVVLLRLTGDGAPDPTFGGGDGEVERDLGGNEEPNDLIIQDDGKLVVTGERDGELFVARFGPGGATDMSFGSGGFNTAAEPANGRSLTLQPNGRIVAAGDGADDIAVARFRP